MKTNRITFLGLLCVMALMLIAAGTEVSAQNRLAFDQNNEAHAAGTISRGQSRKYVFSAEEGEQISVTISSDYAQSMKLTVVNAETATSSRTKPPPTSAI